ncbi:ABC transporter substrate-binding protein, partial [Natrialba sp. SSL1]|uniref:ABC transporter substrate-binding protein n=1 Tax=Natrialba sp. SSL1 TaxID=1869245 RepID=UPI00209ADC32
RFDHEEYNELAMEQRSATDDDERQQLVYECQEILGEQRPEQQQIYDEYIKGFNSDRIDPDSIVVHPLFNGFANVWNWTNLEPLNEEGETLVTNNWDPSDQLNPFHHNARGPSRNNNPTRFLHDFLARPDPETFEPEPWAAEEWDWEDDETLVVQVRDDMVFHDGEPVTVEDVIWSYETAMETEAPAYAVFVDPIDEIEQTGEWEVTFHLEEPYVPFISSTLGEVPILPQHYWEDLIEETGYGDAPWEIVIDDDQPIVASGPFQWGSWDQGERFEMPAFDDHPFAAPNIEMRVQRPLSTRDAELESLRQGDYDILDYWFGDFERLEETIEEA